MVNEDVRKTLRSLCMSYGWSYAVFWGFDPLNHKMLTMEDAYFEEHSGSIVESMLLQVHMIGQGIIGEAAFNGKHKWISVDDHTMMQVLSLDNSDFGLQFLAGTKTVAVVPLELRGVVQFGSIKQISETREFVDQVRKFLQSNVGVAPGGCNSSSLNSEITSSSQNSFCGDVSTSWVNTMEEMGGTIFGLSDVHLEAFEGKNGGHFGKDELLLDPRFGSLVDNTGDMFGEQFVTDDYAPLFDTFRADDLVQWLVDSSGPSDPALNAMLSDGNLNAFGVDSMATGLGGDNVFSGIQGNELASSSQSSLSNALPSSSCGEVELPNVNSYGNASKTEFETDIRCGKLEDSLKHEKSVLGGTFNPSPFDSCTNLSESISEVKCHPAAAPRKGLFSELGLENLLRDPKGSSSSCSIKSGIDEQWPASKKRRVEAYQTNNNQIQHPGSSWVANLAQPPSIGSQFQHFGYSKESMTKSQAELWTDSIDAKSCISTVHTQDRKLDETAKPSKKRGKPGESTKPRPKDRQMIADRIKELREMIPNGSKLSIDALLSRTFKHMVFMQNLTEQADKLKQTHKPKLICQDKGLVQKGGSRNATWAYEVGGTNLFCPIVVEDLGQPGHMLIEMLCEEQGNFLEIADIVRGFGLIILKGVMEERNGKVWAQFTVEATNKHITRMDVFVSLMQLFQSSKSRELISTTAEPAKVVENLSPLWTNHQQHAVPLSI